MEWKTVKLGDVCKIFGRIGFRGYTNNDFVTKPEDGAITLSPTNIVDGELDLTKCAYINWDKYYESPEIMVQENDILLSKTGTIGRTALVKRVEHPMTINPQFVLLKECTINSRYLSYLLKTPKFQGDLYSITVGSVIATLSQKNLGNIKIDIVDSATQDKIVAILSSLDDKIENNNRINRNLEAQAQALFKSWFVDFEPWGGTMPDDWEEGTLGDIIEIKYGKDHKKLSDGEIPVYGSGGLMRHAEKALYTGESVLIPRKGTLNNVMYVNEAFWTVDTMFYSIPKQDHVMLYAYLYLSNINLSSLNAGSAVPSMTTEILNKMKLVIPDVHTLKMFDNKVSTLYSAYKCNRHENQRLAALRDTLLPKLMKGEIAV